MAKNDQKLVLRNMWTVPYSRGPQIQSLGPQMGPWAAVGPLRLEDMMNDGPFLARWFRTKAVILYQVHLGSWGFDWSSASSSSSCSSSSSSSCWVSPRVSSLVCRCIRERNNTRMVHFFWCAMNEGERNPLHRIQSISTLQEKALGKSQRYI